ncbi:MAG: hypothetical protein Tsb0020_06670 [Haliangiales bacterium]
MPRPPRHSDPSGARSSRAGEPAAPAVAQSASGPAHQRQETALIADPRRARGARRALRRKLAIFALVLGVSLGVVVTRSLWSGVASLAEGDGAHARGEEQAAIVLWRRAARWYVPGASHVGLAYDRLEELAEAAEARGDRDTALAAWRGIRRSILATRSLYVPHRERLEVANQRIAALMATPAAPTPAAGADEPAGDGADNASEPALAAWHYERLARPLAPSPLWSVIALLGFATWLAGGLLFALRGVSADDQLVPRTAGYAGVLIAVGLIVWLLGLHLA